MLKIMYNMPRKTALPLINKIRYVFYKLPKDIQEKIDNDCMIILIGHTYGYRIGKSEKNFIILNFPEMKQHKLSLKEQRFIIAHEFAHYILNHTGSTPKEEDEANRLVQQWEFSL